MASIKILQRNKPLKDGTYSIVLQIIKDRKRKLITLGWSCSKEEFSGNEFTKKMRDFRGKNLALMNLKLKAEKILDEFVISDYDFTLEEFEIKFRGKTNKKAGNVFEFFRLIIKELERSNKLGTSRGYKETMQSFEKFLSKEIHFDELTPSILHRYEVHLRERDNCDGGISFKMRHLRSLYNKAIVRGEAKQNNYPFKGYKISKLKRKSVKKSLSLDEFKQFKSFNIAQHPQLAESYYYFMFSFYTRGMNFVDMMKLRWSNINNKKLSYTRSKTGHNFVLKLLPEAISILDYFKSINPSTNFVFPILLNEGMSSKQIENRKKKVLQKFNQDLKEIANISGINKNITSYVARHTYATLLKQSGTSTEVISEGMGHSDVKITNTYLKEFDSDFLDHAHDILSSF